MRSTMMWVLDPALADVAVSVRGSHRDASSRAARCRTSCPGKSPLPGLDKNLTDRFGTPYEPRLGGAETMYPEYIEKMKPMPKPTEGGGGRVGGGQLMHRAGRLVSAVSRGVLAQPRLRRDHARPCARTRRPAGPAWADAKPAEA